MQATNKSPVCMTIAGLDPSGGAGVIADITTFAAFGCFPTAGISSITFQNASGVFGRVHQTAGSIRKQIKAVLDEYNVAAVKIGMLPTSEIIEEVAKLAEQHRLQNVVVDPVIRSTSGFDLIDEAALSTLAKVLFPLAELITPNIPEAEMIAGMKINTEDQINVAGEKIRSLGAKNVLIKGGHFGEKINCGKATDYLFAGSEMHVFESEVIETGAIRGTGCRLSSAIAANLALGKGLVGSVRIAKEFVAEGIRRQDACAPLI